MIGTPEKPTVILVEDNEPMRLVVNDILGYRPINLLQADSGEALLALCQPPASPDLIILDLNLASHGRLSGLEAIKRLAVPIPFIVLTVDNTVRTIRAAAKAGARAYVVKPPSANNLIPALELVLFERAQKPLNDTESESPS